MQQQQQAAEKREQQERQKQLAREEAAVRKAEAAERKEAQRLEVSERKMQQQQQAAEKREQQERQKQLAREEAAVRKAEAAERKEAQRLETMEQRRRESELSSLSKKKSSTISLNIFQRADPSDSPAPSPAPKTKTKSIKAPRGVPVITGWSYGKDGAISGSISGSDNFDEGEFITTSRITTAAAPNTVVTTGSGSRYFLQGEESKGGINLFSGLFNSERGAESDEASEQSGQSKLEAAARKQQQQQQQQQQAAEKREQQERQKRNKLEAAARKQQQDQERELARQEADERKQQQKQEQIARAAAAKQKQLEKKKAEEERKRQLKIAREASANKQQRGKQQKQEKVLDSPPRGVPSIFKFKKQPDNSISGLIFGSPAYDDGERITTSPIVRGDIADGSLVVSGSGSKYFLTTKKPSLTPAPIQPKSSGNGGLGIFGKSPSPSGTKAVEKKSPSKAQALESGGGLFSFMSSPASAPPSTPSKPKTSTPKGIPVLSDWRVNVDNSITGIVSNSPNFVEGERVTTSPIAKPETIDDGAIVVTGSGSKYYLE